MERKYFTFYKSFAESLLKCDEKTQYEVIRAMIDYSFYNKEVELNGVADALWVLIKPVLDANNKKFDNGCKGGEFGKLGGRPKTPKKPQENPTQTPMVIKSKNNDKENENEEGETSVDNLIEDNGEGSVLNKNRTTTIPEPTYENVIEYAKSMQLNLEDTKAFFYHYDAQGWVTGQGATIRNWKSKLKSWCFDNSQKRTAEKLKNETWQEKALREHEERERMKAEQNQGII